MRPGRRVVTIVTDIAQLIRRETGLPFRADIEGLRALAVGLVIAFHAQVPQVGGGFIGVDVFFVISGYLITALIASEIEQTGTVRVAAFIARRIRRLLPAAFTVLTATVVLAALVQPPLQLIGTANSVRAAFAYASNIHFYDLASDYFNGNVRSDPTLHVWSLAVEEQFYLAWPWILLWCGAPRQDSVFNRRRLVWCLIALALVSFVAANWLTATNRSLAFYGTPLRAWEFAAGGITWFAQSHAAENSGGHRLQWITLLGWLGIALIAGAAMSYSALTEFPGSAALVPVLGTAALLYRPSGISSLPAGSPGRLLASAPMRWIGRRSYSWYLWHWPLLALSTAVVVNSGLVFRVSMTLVALVVADLTHRWVETPLRKPAASRVSSQHNAWTTIRLGAFATLVLITASTVMRQAAAAAANGPTQRRYTAAASDIAKPYLDRCVTELTDDRVRPCVYGAESSPTTVALFGDSHAVQWYPALEAIARERGWRLLLVAKRRCATADVPVYDPNTSQRSSTCERWREAAIDTIVARRVSLVLTGNSAVYVQGPGVGPEIQAVPLATWEHGLARTLNRFHDNGISAAIIRDTPYLHANVPMCLARSGWLGHLAGTCATDRVRAVRNDVAVAEKQLASAMLGGRVVDLTDRLCTATSCSPVIAGIIAYSDNEHLTATLVRSLTTALSRDLDELGLRQLGNDSNIGDQSRATGR